MTALPRCGAILTQGKRAGEPCGWTARYPSPDGPRCMSHARLIDPEAVDLQEDDVEEIVARIQEMTVMLAERARHPKTTEPRP